MELVDGTPITAYADQHNATVRDRLLLMMQACAAVQHAHQKAIIHRDIKPSNILVTERDGMPVVKVIDFGVAKAIEKSSGQQTLFTEVGQMVGTPEYMSPEQADGKRDVDTRSDVYSLGAVLYELLSGSLPFDSDTLRSAGYGEVCRIIREVEPPRPSARLSKLGADSAAVAEHRQSSPAGLAEQLRSELDWIVIKSLSKDRDARYSSPQELAEDIENYLTNRPLRAGPESMLYRARKFFRRNRAGVIGAAAAVALLIGGVAATSWQAYRATKAEHATREEQSRTLAEKNRAEAAQKDAEAANLATSTVNGFLTDMLQSVSPEYAQGRPVRVMDLIDKAAADVGTRLKDQPKVEAEIRMTLGGTYSSLGAFDKADEHLTAAMRLYQQLGGNDSRDAMRAEQRLASLRTAQDRLDDASKIMTSLLDRCRAKLGPDDTLTNAVMGELAVLCDHRGDTAEAERIFKELLANCERSGKTNTEDYYLNLGNYGSMLRVNDRLDEAEPLTLRAYQGMAKLKGENDPTAIDMNGVYGDVLRLQGRLAEAEPIMRDYFTRAMAVYGPDRSGSIDAEQGFAIVLELEGKSDEALEHFRGALERMRKVMGNDHRETLMQVSTLAAQRFKHRDYAEAEQLFREAHAGWSRTVGPDHLNTLNALYGLIVTFYPRENWADALEPAKEMYERVRDEQRVQIPPARRARYLSAYGVVLDHLGRGDEAVVPLLAAYEAMVKEEAGAKVFMDAYSSVVRSLVHVAEQCGETEKAAYWTAELSRFGPPPPVSPRASTAPATQAATMPASAPAR
jgi:tetratricopeptide (TPR) repeat protein